MFPLEEGHVYARIRHARCHDGENPLDRVRLQAVQQRLRFAWGKTKVDVGSSYDGPTSNAVWEVKTECGLPATGWLDRDTWEAIFRGPVGLAET